MQLCRYSGRKNGTFTRTIDYAAGEIKMTWYTGDGSSIDSYKKYVSSRRNKARDIGKAQQSGRGRKRNFSQTKTKKRKEFVFRNRKRLIFRYLPKFVKLQKPRKIIVSFSIRSSIFITCNDPSTRHFRATDTNRSITLQVMGHKTSNL